MKFGELEAVRLLGKGGMSEVWEAESPRLGARRAVKLYAYAKDDAEVRARFEQEGRMLAALRHPRVVGVSDIGRTDDGRPYFVMDLVLDPDGKPRSLSDVPAGGADEEEIARWYDDIRDGLAYIHARGIVHRDLKLENVMIGPDGHAVLADFGISRVLEAKDGRSATVVDPVHTIIGIRDGKKTVMGSLGYLAPELEMGCAATRESDWYALGVIVYRLLTGTWCDARTDLAGTLDTFDPAWLKIVPQLLHANPAGRACPSFAETRRALQESEAATAETRYLKEKRRGHVARHVARWAGAACALLAAVLLYGGLEMRSERQILRLRLQQAGTRVGVPTFDELFAIPAGAKADETTDQDGNVTMPSRASFEQSRVDALVLVQRKKILTDLSVGSITYEKAIADLESMAERLEEDSDATSPLDELEFGGTTYTQMGDNESLRRLLLQAAEKLRARSEAE